MSFTMSYILLCGNGSKNDFLLIIKRIIRFFFYFSYAPLKNAYMFVCLLHVYIYENFAFSHYFLFLIKTNSFFLLVFFIGVCGCNWFGQYDWWKILKIKFYVLLEFYGGGQQLKLNINEV